MRLPKRDFLRTTAAVGLGNTAGRLIAFLFMMVLAGIMSESAYGRVRYVLSVATISSTVVAAGLPSAMTRFLAREKGSSVERDSYFTNIVLIFGVFLVLTEVFVAVFQPSDPVILLVILGYSVPLLYMGVIRGMMQYTKFASMSFLRNSIKLLILIVLIYLSAVSENTALMTYAFGGWIAILLLEYVHPAGLHFRISTISRARMKEVVLYSIPVFVTTLAFATITQAPNIVLRAYMGYESVAVFSIAYTFTLLYAFVPFAVLTIAMPEIAAVRDRKRRMDVFLASSAVILASGIALFVLTVLLGRWGLELLFHGKYDAAFEPLVILSLGAILLGIRNAYAALWEGSGRPSLSTYDTVLGGVVTLGTAYLLIPMYGINGAAYSFVLGLLSSVLLSTFFLMLLMKERIELK